MMADIKNTLEMIVIPEWHKDASCRGHANPDLWFPESRTPYARVHAARALLICASCPVRKLCLEEAMSKDEKHGIRGGKTTRQRVRMRMRMTVRS